MVLNAPCPIGPNEITQKTAAEPETETGYDRFVALVDNDYKRTVPDHLPVQSSISPPAFAPPPMQTLL